MIKVNSQKEQTEYIDKEHKNWKLFYQNLSFLEDDPNKPIDTVTIFDNDLEKEFVYEFDVSSFFGLGEFKF